MDALYARDKQLPYFSATTVAGKKIDLWSFKQRSNLLILLQGGGPAAFEAAADELAARADEWKWQDTEVVIISRQELSGRVPADGFHSVTDPDGSLRRTLAGGATGAVLLLADKFGALYSRWQPPDGDTIDMDDVEKTVRLMQSECPECGDKGWLDQI